MPFFLRATLPAQITLRYICALLGAVVLFHIALSGFHQAPAQASSASSRAVAYALAQVGDRYSYGAEGPGAFDCSGLTYAAYGAAGVSIPRSSSGQFGALQHVARGDLRAGDLVFFYSPISHVGLYLGNGKMVNAQSSGAPVAVESVMWSSYSGAARPTG